jgi:hypothetical protein
VKIVIVSDIHANLEALTALPERYDELWVLGDLVNYGPNPSEVIDFVRTNASVVTRGNHDHAIGFNEDPRCSPPFREMAQATQQYTSSALSESQKQFLRDLPLRVARELGVLSTRLIALGERTRSCERRYSAGRAYALALRSQMRRASSGQPRELGPAKDRETASLLRRLGRWHDRASIIRLSIRENDRKNRRASDTGWG